MNINHIIVALYSVTKHLNNGKEAKLKWDGLIWFVEIWKEKEVMTWELLKNKGNLLTKYNGMAMLNIQFLNHNRTSQNN